MALVSSALLSRKHVSMDICNHRLGVCNCELSIRNHPLGIRNPYVSVNCQLGLKGGRKLAGSRRNQMNAR